MSTEYNGWPSRETWRVQLHLQNNHELASRCRRYAETISGQWCMSVSDQRQRAGHEVGTLIREHVLVEAHALFPDTQNDGVPMLACDFVDEALGRVDWDAIGHAWVEPFAEVPA